jgi:Mn-containing catalase
MATVDLTGDDEAVAKALAKRTKSDPAANPTTGADLGAGPGAGKMSDEDMGGASDVKDAVAKADAMTAA